MSGTNFPNRPPRMMKTLDGAGKIDLCKIDKLVGAIVQDCHEPVQRADGEEDIGPLGSVVVLVALPASLLLGLDLAPHRRRHVIGNRRNDAGREEGEGASRRMCRSMAVLGLD
jgi:hypothetical protein